MGFLKSSVACLAAAATFATAQTASSSACGSITDQYTKFYGDDTNSGSIFSLDPSLALDCLMSSAINTTAASLYAVEFKKYLQFQTTLAYIKSPPSNYPYAPFDTLQEIDNIATSAANGTYKSQYEFDAALQGLIQGTKEGHIFAQFCSQVAIVFKRGISLVSISTDGVTIPKIYELNDAIEIALNVSSPSPVTQINGQDVVAYLNQWALLKNADPDAIYNELFWSPQNIPSSASSDGTGTFTGAGGYFPFPDESTNVTFANGTSKSFATTAEIGSGIWDSSIVDGNSFTDFFCVQPANQDSTSDNSTATATASATATATATATKVATTEPPTATVPSYPYIPVAKDINNQVAGYFLNDTEFQDTAVLLSNIFENGTDGAVTYQSTVHTFIAKAKAANKTKLIIDLSGNPGGSIIVAYDLFAQLFPKIVPYGAGRARGSPAMDIWGQIFSAVGVANLSATALSNSSDSTEAANILSSPYEFQVPLTANLTDFASWRDLYPPFVNHGDNFTNLIRYNLSDLAQDAFLGVVPYGHGNMTLDYTDPPFAAENIVILTDGVCASTCSIFSEFMTRQANVKTIAIGGRPQTQSMQAIGGTKGSNAITLSSLLDFSVAAEALGVPDSQQQIANDYFPDVLPLGDPSVWTKFSLNWKDNIALGDTTNTPLQFIYEPANCRIFYTAETLFSPASLWAYVANVAWKGGACVANSTTNGTGSAVTGTVSQPTSTSVSNSAGGKTASVSALALAVPTLMMLLL